MTSGPGFVNRYTVEKSPAGDSEWMIHEQGEYYPLGRMYSQAVAELCVFALNAVANSRHLARSTEIEPNGGFDRWDFYDGPTDGVAPK